MNANKEDKDEMVDRANMLERAVCTTKNPKGDRKKEILHRELYNSKIFIMNLLLNYRGE